MCRYWQALGLAVLFFAIEAVSGTINCEPLTTGASGPWTTLDTPFELNVSQVANTTRNVNITVGSGVANYTRLYTISQVNVGNMSATCSENYYGGIFYTMVKTGGAAVNTIGSDVIYPTSVPGIGISVVTTTFATGQAIKRFPDVVFNSVTGTINDVNGKGMWLAITIWKIPGALPVSTGAITFTGPTVAEVLMSSVYSAYTSSDPARLLGGGKAWISSSRVLMGTLIFQPTTCDLQMPTKTVQMGTYAGGDKSAWKDASFTLACPDAYGYGGSTSSNDGYAYPNSVKPNSTISANTVQNKPLRIQISPYTQVIDATQGIIGLNNSGAEGYGIQLAWGDATTLGSGTPASPVQLNSWTYAYTLNPAAYRNTAYNIGGKALTNGQNGIIKMAARYVRTSSNTSPGPANASVEVLANYE